jgi:hypothetical protein
MNWARAAADADEALSVQIAQTFIRLPPVEAFTVAGAIGNRNVPVAILYEKIPITYDRDPSLGETLPNFFRSSRTRDDRLPDDYMRRAEFQYEHAPHAGPHIPRRLPEQRLEQVLDLLRRCHAWHFIGPGPSSRRDSYQIPASGVAERLCEDKRTIALHGGHET